MRYFASVNSSAGLRKLARRVAASLPLALVACTGVVGSTDGQAGGVTPVGDSPGIGTTPGGAGATGTTNGTGGGGAAANPTPAPGTPLSKPDSVLISTSRTARLSQLQWANTVKDLLQLSDLGGVDASLTKDALVNFDNEGDSLRVGEDLRSDLQLAAETLSKRVATDPAALARIMPANAPTEIQAKAKAFIAGFGSKAYRRPLTDQENAEALTLFNSAPALYPSTDAFVAGAQLLLQFFLQSPNFLYRTELSTTVVDGKIPLTGYEAASKLSYALTNTMPDAALFAAAAADQLRTIDQLTAQASRLLDSPAGTLSLEHFYFQMLKLGSYAGITKDQAAFPAFKATTPASMSKETTLFLDWVFSQKLGVKDIFVKPVSFVNNELAPIYGLSGNFTAEFKQVDLDPTQRAGLMTQPGFLASNAHEKTIDSIHRGVFVLQRLLCIQLSPPANAMITPVPDDDGTTTNRERVNAHTGPGTCGAGCHATIINPGGFAFENFDAIGAYRTTDNNKPINAADTYPFTVNGQPAPKSFDGAVQFSAELGASEQVHSCFSQNWMSYLYGRTVDPTKVDAPMVGYIAQRSLKDGLSIRDMVMNLITTDNFLARLPGGS